MNKLNHLTDKHIKFIDLNPWLKDINFNNVDIIECKSINLYKFILSLIVNRVIQCNILISLTKNRFYYNGKHYYNKIRYVFDNVISDYLIDSKDNQLFSCENKYDTWTDYKYDFELYNDLDIEVNKEDLILTYINE